MASRDKILASAQKNLQKGQIPKAIKDYKKLVEMDPKDTRNRQKLAELYSRVQQNEEALEEYEQVANHYGGRGFYLKAIAVYKQMQKLAPEKADVYYQLAELNKKQGLIGNALAELRTLVSIYEKAKNVPETIKVLEAMRELDPDNLNIRVKVAETYAKHQLNEKAFTELEELSATLRSLGDPDKLLKLYEIFLPLYPNNLEIKIGTADALVRKGEGQKALTILQGVLSEHPDDPGVLKMLAAAYRIDGDPENELLTYKHLLKLQPKDLDLRESFLRACLAHKSETDRIIENLDSWQDDFLAAGRQETLRDFCTILLETVPGESRVEGLAARLGMESEPQSAAEADEAAEVDKEVVSVQEERPIEEPSFEEEPPIPETAEPVKGEPEEPLPAAGLSTAEAEEIPLDFLQRISTDGVPESADAVPAPERISSVEEEAATEEDELEPPDGMETEAEPSGGATGESVSEPGAEGDFEDEAPSDDFVEMEIELEFDKEEILEETDDTDSISFPADASAADLEGDPASADDGFSGSESIGSGADEDLGGIHEPEPAEEEEKENDAPETGALLELEEVIPAEEVESSEESIEDLSIEDLEEEFEELEEVVEIESGGPVEGDEDPPVEDLVELETEYADDGEAAPSKLVEELEEVEFYLRQGLLNDAERVCQDLRGQFPGAEEVEEKLQVVLQAREDMASRRPEEAGDFFDLGSEVIEEIEHEVGDFLEESVPEEEDSFNLDGFFSDSQKGVETKIDAEDTESHYNLGIAYKEMGLLEEAIAEFDQASNNPQRRIDCLTLKGLCLIQQGHIAEAEEALRTALAEPDLPPEKEVNLNFELGLLFQGAGRYEEALHCFRLVSERDHFFREVGERITELEGLLGNPDQKKDEPDQKDKRDRISYV